MLALPGVVECVCVGGETEGERAIATFCPRQRRGEDRRGERVRPSRDVQKSSKLKQVNGEAQPPKCHCVTLGNRGPTELQGPLLTPGPTASPGPGGGHLKQAASQDHEKPHPSLPAPH